MRERYKASVSRAREAHERGFEYLDSLQRPDASWVGKLSSSAIATALSCLALQMQPDPEVRARVRPGLEWLLKTQHKDGSWGDSVTDPGAMNPTTLSAVALHYCAPGEFEDEVRRARLWVDVVGGGFKVINTPFALSMGGPIRCLYALVGWAEWHELTGVKPLPMEVILMPGRVRKAVSITFNAYLTVALWLEKMNPAPAWRQPIRRQAIRASMDWLREAQDEVGSYGESALLTAWSMIAHHHTDFGGEEKIIARALPYILKSQRPDGSWPIDRDLENFDTGQAVLAYEAARRPVPQGNRVRDWFLRNQYKRPCFHTSSPPGGWGWCHPGGWPDADDTAYTLRALRILGLPPEHESIRAGVGWLYQLQNSDGSWPTFVRNSRMPFDHDDPYITGQVLSALAAVGEGRSKPAQRALAYLRQRQNADGSSDSLWFRRHTCGTWRLIETLVDLGLTDDPMLSRAAKWLLTHQNDDGGWGDGYGQPSTAEETAWATAALLRIEPVRFRRAIEDGIGWLVEHQREDGGWDEDNVAVYFSFVIYSNAFYALSYPLISLSRYLKSELAS